jgi:hypothetical protein
MTDESRPVHVKKETRWLFKVRYVFQLSDVAEALGVIVQAALKVSIFTGAGAPGYMHPALRPSIR